MRSKMTFVCALLAVMLTATCAPAAPIHDAAAKGDLAKVKALLKAKPELINSVDGNGATPLHHAVAVNHKAVVEFLLANKANVNAKRTNGVTPLHIAAAMGRLEIAEVLLSKGAEPQAIDNKGRTAMSLAETNGHVAILALLTGSKTPTAQGAKTASPLGNSKPLMSAIGKSLKEIASLLGVKDTGKPAKESHGYGWRFGFQYEGADEGATYLVGEDEQGNKLISWRVALYFASDVGEAKAMQIAGLNGADWTRQKPGEYLSSKKFPQMLVKYSCSPFVNFETYPNDKKLKWGLEVAKDPHYQ